MRVLANGKAIGAIVSFAPPSIENAQVQTAMAAGFHPAGARGFERAARGIKPDVAAGDHLASDVHVVVFDKNQVALQIAVLAQVNDVLDVAFAVVVPRVSFSRENKLDRPGLVAREFYDVVELLKDQ